MFFGCDWGLARLPGNLSDNNEMRLSLTGGTEYTFS